MIPCLHFGLRHVSGRFPIEPKLASWVESGYKSPESPGPRQRGRRRDGLSRRRRGQFRSTAPYPAATNSRGVSKPSARRDNGLTFYDAQATGPGEEPELPYGCAPTGERLRSLYLLFHPSRFALATDYWLLTTGYCLRSL